MNPEVLAKITASIVGEKQEATEQKSPELMLYERRRTLASQIADWTRRYPGTCQDEGKRVSRALPFSTTEIRGIERQIFVRAQVSHVMDEAESELYSSAGLRYFVDENNLVQFQNEIIWLETIHRTVVALPIIGEDLPTFYFPLKPLAEEQVEEYSTAMDSVQESLTHLDELYPLYVH